MFNLQECGRAGSDCTGPYKVILDKPYTVRTFIDAILKRKKEWGSIRIKKGRKIFYNNLCEYRYGKILNEMDESFLNETVVSVAAHGGYTNMDYIIKI